MIRKIFGGVLFSLVISIVLCGCEGPKIKSMADAQVSSTPTAVSTNIIEIKNGNFSPQIVKLSTGSKLTFINEDGASHRIASDPHPTDDDLAALNSQVLYKNETFSVVISQIGEYKFHLEDNPSVGGKIIVEQKNKNNKANGGL